MYINPETIFINPRRACATRVTVVVLSVRLSVCAHSILGLQATRVYVCLSGIWLGGLFMYINPETIFINPRRACATRVTVVVLSVRLSVCAHSILGLQATRRLMSDTNSFSATRERKIMWRFC